MYIDLNVKHLFLKVAEIEHLKLRLKQHHDYDEIKRELEIMKVTRFKAIRLFY
jgi:homeobox protein cut-like